MREDISGLTAVARGGDSVALERLVVLLVSQHRIREALGLLREISPDNPVAAGHVTEILLRRGEFSEVERLLDEADRRGDPHTTAWWNQLHHARGDAAALRANAERGDRAAAVRLLALLDSRAQHAEADRWLSTQQSHGDLRAWVGHTLANRLDEREDVEGLRRLADAGNSMAAECYLAAARRHHGYDVLEQWAAAGHSGARTYLTELLAERGDADVLRGLASTGDTYAEALLIELLCSTRDVAALASEASNDNAAALTGLIRLLVEDGDQAGLQELAEAGHLHAARALAKMQMNVDDLAGALETLTAYGDQADAETSSLVAHILYRAGDRHGLEARAETGDDDAAGALVALLIRLKDRDALWDYAAAGRPAACRALADALDQWGYDDDAALVRRLGLDAAGRAMPGPDAIPGPTSRTLRRDVLSAAATA